MSSNDSNVEKFQVLEPEKIEKKEQISEQKSYEGKLDPRLITFSVTNFVLNVGISQITPFYPDLAANKAHLSYSQIGFVLGVNSLGSLLMSFIIGGKMMQWGRKRCLIVALIGQIIILSLFGCLNYMTANKALFFGMSMTTRIIQGASRAVYSTVTLAYVPIFWPNEFQKKLAVMETMTALGQLFGPIIGSILNYFFGYSIPFFMVAFFFLVSIVPIMILIPRDGTSSETSQQKTKVPIFQALKSIKVVLTILNVTVCGCGFIFINPFFMNHMAAFGISPNAGAFVLTIPALCYILNVNVVPRLQKKCLKTFLMSSALLICFFGNMIEAPFWGITNDIVPVIFGLMFVGAAQAFSTIPSIPQLVEFLTPVINDPALKAGISDIAASLFIMSFSLGSLVGPFSGGATYDHFGGNVDWTSAIQDGQITNQALYDQLCHKEKIVFRQSCMVLGCMELGVGMLFFFFADGYKGWQDMFRRLSSKGNENTSLNQPFINSSNAHNNDELLNELSPSIQNKGSQSSLEQIKITRETV